MDILISLFSFSFITSFTPGPNNILAMTYGINTGFKSTIPFQIGAFIACFVMMLGLLILGSHLEKIIPAIIPTMRYLGCAYMIYLAGLVFFTKPQLDTAATHKSSVWMGFLLQFINPKYYLYIVTLASVLIPHSNSFLKMVFYSLYFTIIGIAGIFTWAWCGALLQGFLRKYYRIANTIMAIALVYCAYTLL